MNRLPSVNQTAELLNQLRTTIQEFAQKEEELNRSYRARTDLADQRFRKQIEELQSQFSENKAKLEFAYADRQALLLSLNESRRTRISKAETSSKRKGIQKVTQEEDRRKYRVQKGSLDTERNRKESLARNDARLAELQRQLTDFQEAFTALEVRAQQAFGGYGLFKRFLSTEEGSAELNLNEDELLINLAKTRDETATNLERFESRLLPKLFRYLPIWLLIFLVAGATAGAVPLAKRFAEFTLTYTQVAAGGAGGVIFLLVLYFLGRSNATQLAKNIAQSLSTARRMEASCLEKAQYRHAQEAHRIELESQGKLDAFNNEWHLALEAASAARGSFEQKHATKLQRVTSKHAQLHQARLDQALREYRAHIDQLTLETEKTKNQLTESHRLSSAKSSAEYQSEWQRIESEWKSRIQFLNEQIQEATALAESSFASRPAPDWQAWNPPLSFQNAARFGRLEIDLRHFAEKLPEDPRLSYPGPAPFSIPLLLRYPDQGSILLETNKGATDAVTGALNNIILRLLAGSPPGKLSFTIIDPVKLGQNFASIMHLADYEENIVNNRIWTQPTQIEERLTNLNEHMEKVIQMYLRNEYATIADYNIDAGNIAEKYHFVVIADFPSNFTDNAIRRLLRIAASGARCGVYTLIHWDHRYSAPPDFVADELRKSSICILCGDNSGTLTMPSVKHANVHLDLPPSPDLATAFLHKVGETSCGTNRVEVPFSQIAPQNGDFWNLSTEAELRIPIGRAGATKLQYLALGKGTKQHVLIAGKTGSGKSTLFHVIITNLALWCSPEEVEFYLVDFKKGVEFKDYATQRLPHARVVSIESDREFGLSVLQRVDEELVRRGELFRKLGVQDIAGFRRANRTEPMPRTLVMIDEFQEFFTEDDSISQTAAVLLDRIVRQGRAFGIHVLLGSQTLGGAYTLARTTMGQMAVRIALQCNEADAYLIMDENNAAPRLLTRPGEGIYNDMSGAAEGNSPFQTVWLPDYERSGLLQHVREQSELCLLRRRTPIVFEGNAPADVRDNQLLQDALRNPAPEIPSKARIWLGAPNSIKRPTEAAFERNSGSNLLVISQRTEAVNALLALSLVALAAQYPAGSVRMLLLQSAPSGSPERAGLETVIQSLPHQVITPNNQQAPDTIRSLAEELKARLENEKHAMPTTFLIIHGLQHFKSLRQDDDFSFSSDSSDQGANAAREFQELISDGPSQGIHVIATLDTYNNVVRFLGRKTLTEFDLRVLFQMSSSDSSSLCDDPKASMLGLHRALFYNQHEGSLETFRPYSYPDREWIENIRAAFLRTQTNQG